MTKAKNIIISPIGLVAAITLMLITIGSIINSDKSLVENVHAQTATPIKVAIIGDTGRSSSSTGFQGVLDLIAREPGVELVLHQGDNAYGSVYDENSVNTWKSRITNTLPGIPYLGSEGNHEADTPNTAPYWTAPNSYADFYQGMMNTYNIPGSDPHIDEYWADYKGIKIVFTGDEKEEATAFLQSQLSGDDRIWKICSWHKNQKNTTPGPKGNGYVWSAFETCRQNGALILNGHAHVYGRSKTVTSFSDNGLTVDPNCSSNNHSCVDKGKTVVIDSSLGGLKRALECSKVSNNWWAAAYGTNGQLADLNDDGVHEINNCGSGSGTVGALFMTFNCNGNPNLACGEFKNVNGQVIDRFDITAAGTPQPPYPTNTPAPNPTNTPAPTPPPSGGPVLRVPGDYSTIEAAYNAANHGDEILVAAGNTFDVCLSGKRTKRITIRAEYPAAKTSNPDLHTTLNSACSHVVQFKTPLDSNGVFEPGDHVEFIGFVLNGSDDGFSYEGASGIVKDNIISGQTDDPIDIDGGSEAYVFGNILKDGAGGGDGIENRLHSFNSNGRVIKMIFKDNIIFNMKKDGIQLIGSVDAKTDRKYLIANNLIIGNLQAGLGTTGSAVSDQGQYKEGYPLPEQMYIINNTFVNNGWGAILGGANMKVHNNIFYNNGGVAVKNVAGNSEVTHNLYFGNSTNYQGSNIQNPNVTSDPKLINTSLPLDFSSFELADNSPAIDAGKNVNSFYSEFGLTPPGYSGSAPDLGWKESGSVTPPTSTPSVTATQTPTPPPASDVPGDGNGDGKVDGLDYVIWFTHYNTTTNQGPASGDFNSNGKVDGLDYVIWFTHYDSSSPLPTATPTPVVPICGDQSCNGNESCNSCPGDCGSCNTDSYIKTFSPLSDDIANPERGFMKQSSIYPDQSGQLDKIRRKEPTDSLVWVYFRLENYRYEDQVLRPLEPLGSGRGLDVIKGTFDAAREKGLKLVIRFIYNWGPGSTSDPNSASPDVPLHVAQHHLNQVRPLLEQNTDVIAAMQVGYVGHWGEWHSSKYLYNLESKRAIVDSTLAALPPNRSLLIRYPRYKEIMFGSPLTSQQAYTKSDKSRIGHHNDCFLEGSDDGGTYRSHSGQPQGNRITSNYCDGQNTIACWKDFIAQDGNYTPVGGESCQYNPPRTDCTNALNELETLHWSFINNGYRPEVLDGWRSGGCWDEIRRKLGYRLVLNSAKLPNTLSPGDGFDIEIELKNEGFASMYNERPVYVVLKNNSSRYEILLDNIDPRRWGSNGTHTINKTFTVPLAISSGTYDLAIWLPDQFQSLRQDPQYSVRFANSGVWEASTGLNVLTKNLQITN